MTFALAPFHPFSSMRLRTASIMLGEMSPHVCWMRSLAWLGSASYRLTVRMPVPHALSSVTRSPVVERLSASRPACLIK